MDYYELNSTVRPPGNSTAFMEFSPNSRFLAVGDQDLCSLYILDKLAGFHQTISSPTPAKPTALVWETPTTFYVGLSDGRFIHYRIDLVGDKLVKGTVNNSCGVFPVTAIALDVEAKTLVMSVGPDVFAFRRVRATSRFFLLANQGDKLTWFKVNSALSQTFQAVSVSRGILEAKHPHSQDLFVLPLITRSSSRFAGKT